MYLHLGQDTLVSVDDIIGIFDLDSTTVSRHTRKFLNCREKEGLIIPISYELPKSFILCKEKKKTKSVIYLSQLSPATLRGRADYIHIITEKDQDKE